MSLNRHAKKRDSNEGPIKEVWREMGAYAEPISNPGSMDHLVHYRGHAYRAETKGAKRGLTAMQVESFTKAYAAGVSTYIIRTPLDARQMLCGQLPPWTPDDGALAGAERKARGFRPGCDKARTLQEMCRTYGCATSRVPGFQRCQAHLADMVMP